MTNKDIKSIKIGGCTVAPGRNCFIIVEVAQAHDGSLGTAHAYIDAIAKAGADAVKFQTHIAYAESTPLEPWRIKFSKQDKTRYEYWQRMEFTEQQWFGLKEHADEKGLIFLSSPFSTEAVELLTRVGVPAWKIASGEINNILMLEHIAATGLPILISTGMSSLDEIDAAVENLKDRKIPFGIMQCTTSYPCPPEKTGLNLIGFFRERYNCPTGLSDHSGTIFPALAAAALGSELLEVHVTFSKQMFGPDVSASLTTDELREMIKGVRYIEDMIAAPVDKDEISKEMQPLRDLFTKSIVVKSDLKAGTVLTMEHLTAKKPGIGIPVTSIPDILGSRLKRDVSINDFLKIEDIEVNNGH